MRWMNLFEFSSLKILALLHTVLLNGKRQVVGVLRGFDQFMNLVLDDSQEIVSEKEKNDIGVVVIRGNSIIQMELLEISTI